MDYQRIYNNLMDRAIGRDIDGYTERHHRVPRCMGGGDGRENLVDLTPEEHYIAHLLLCKIHPGNIKLVCAAMMMCVNSNHTKRNNKAVGWARRRWSEYMKENNPRCKMTRETHPQFYRTGEDHPRFGIPNPISDEGRRVISDKMKSNNPMSGVKPWNHSRATDYSKSVWIVADELYDLWKEHGVSYYKLYELHRGYSYKDRPNPADSYGPYLNAHKYFKKGWVPHEDPDWQIVRGINEV